MSVAAKILTGLVVLTSTVGCRKGMDARRQAWLDGATGCPAPATCSGKMTTATREIAICAPHGDVSALAPGDVVVVHELAIDTVARFSKRSGNRIVVEFPDGAVLERTPDAIVARICR